VGDAMSQKESCVCTIQHTFGRAESQKGNISQYVGAANCDIESGEEYQFEIVGRGKIDLDNEPLAFTGRGHNSSNSFTIPYQIIEEGNIKPGHSVSIGVHEIEEEQEEEPTDENDGRYLDITSVSRDSSASDGMDSRVYSKTAARYLRNHANDKLEYTNVTTGDSVVREAKADYADNVRVSFPIDVRQAINITPSDDVKLAIPEEVKKSDRGRDDPTESISEVKEQIEEMHDMISELYDAYTEVKND